MAGTIPYGLALYKPEAPAPFKPRRSQETQSCAQDVAVLLEAQSVVRVGEGDASGSSIGLPGLSVDEGVAASRPRSAGVAPNGAFRARQLRESPRLTTDLACLSSATAAAPRTTAVSAPGPGRVCSKAVTELMAPPPLPQETGGTPTKGPEGPRRRSRLPRPAPRPTVQSGGSVGGWYNPIPHAAQRIRACREAAKKAGELPEVMKVLDSKGSRQAWGGESSPPSPRQARRGPGAQTMQTLGLTIHVPEVPQFEEEKMPDRVSSLAKQLRIPLDTLKQAYEVFCEICTTLDHPMATKGKKTNKKGEIIEEELDVFQDGEVNIDGFAKVICKLVGCANASELPDGLIHRSFRDADGNGTKSISFLEFAFWYSRHGFMENMLLTSAQLEVRQLARKYDLPVIEVEQYKKKFDLFDEDHSGSIDYQEFQKLLSSLIKVPAHLELPVARMNQFWAEADRDRSQLISFEEFVLFFYRYFRLNTPTLCPFQEYYRGIRRVRVAYASDESGSKAQPKAEAGKKGRSK